MKDILLEINSPLFDGVNPEDRKTMLGCIGYHIGTFKKGDIVAFEEESESTGAHVTSDNRFDGNYDNILGWESLYDK